MQNNMFYVDQVQQSKNFFRAPHAKVLLIFGAAGENIFRVFYAGNLDSVRILYTLWARGGVMGGWLGVRNWVWIG